MGYLGSIRQSLYLLRFFEIFLYRDRYNFERVTFLLVAVSLVIDIVFLVKDTIDPNFLTAPIFNDNLEIREAEYLMIQCGLYNIIYIK